MSWHTLFVIQLNTNVHALLTAACKPWCIFGRHWLGTRRPAVTGHIWGRSDKWSDTFASKCNGRIGCNRPPGGRNRPPSSYTSYCCHLTAWNYLYKLCSTRMLHQCVSEWRMRLFYMHQHISLLCIFKNTDTVQRDICSIVNFVGICLSMPR